MPFFAKMCLIKILTAPCLTPGFFAISQFRSAVSTISGTLLLAGVILNQPQRRNCLPPPGALSSPIGLGLGFREAWRLGLAEPLLHVTAEGIDEHQLAG
jgi:hypothetical protein